MNFIAQVEENLRDLGSEARKKHPGVKEASERAILTLRSLQSQYVSAVRASTSSKNGSTSTPHPTTALFRSQDVLRPFLLACNYPDASSSLLLIGLNAIQLLISGDAVCPEDSVHIARVLGIQAACCCRHSQNDSGTYSSNQSRGGAGGVVASLFGAASSIPGAGYYSSSGFSGSGHRSVKDDEAISLKVLQTLTIMVASKELELSDEVLGQAVSVCLTLISGNERSKEDRNKKKYHRNNSTSSDRDSNGNHLATLGGNDNMRRAAAATLKQILIFTFDRAESNDQHDKDSKHLKMTRHAAASAFADLCALSESRLEGEDRVNKGLPPRSEVKGPFSIHGSSQNKRKSIQPPPRSACFEMLNMILSHKPGLFMGEVTDAQKVMVVNRSDDDMSDSFAALLRYKVCPLVSSFLLSEFNVTELSKSGRDVKNENGKENFSLLMRSTRLACTIIENFGKSKDLISECHILLTALVRFISSSSEAFRDTHEFEDGFIYSIPSQALANDVNPSNTWRNQSSHQVDSNPNLISNILLWRCALALESLYSIVRNPEMLKFLHLSYDHVGDETRLVSLIAECLSDFATTAASNKSSIQSVVRVVTYRQDGGWDESSKSQNILHPQIFARARNITKSYDDWESSLNDQNSNFPNQISIDMASFDEYQIPYCDIGEAIWVAFNCTLSLSSSLHQISFDKSPDMVSLIENSFPPTLTALHHFLKRFPSETYIRNTVLMGFENLAGTCIPYASKDNLQSEALVKSLCVLSIPIWGNMESNCQLQDHHIDTLSTIFSIIHQYHNQFSSNWHVILSTIEKLSSLSISSPHLSKPAYKKAIDISNAFSRLSTFSTCLTSQNLRFFVEALVDLSKHASITSTAINTLDAQDIPRSGTEDDETQSVPSSSLGGKLISFAGRAFANQNSNYSDGKDDAEQRLHSSKIYSSDFLNSAFTHLALTKPTTRKDEFRALPFALVLLTDVTLMNSFRFSACGKPVTNHLCDLASTSKIAIVRSYAMDTLASLVTSRLAGNGTNTFNIENAQTSAIPGASPKTYLETEKNSGRIKSDGALLPPMSQIDLLRPLCQTIADTSAKDAVQAGLNSLHVILESSGHNISDDCWPILISAISASSGTGPLRNGQAWATCGTLAFRCLRLIVDDFLDQLPSPPSPHANATRNALLHCCASFGQSLFDVNTSLTSIGMLWTIADQDSSPSALENVLAKLAFLSCDERAEVRNCSVNTLFSCVVGLGHRFTSNQWKACLGGTIFNVLDKVSTHMGNDHPSEAEEQSSSSTPSRYRVSVHHSRDSNSKQWLATHVLTLRGIERVLRQFFMKLLLTGIENDSFWFEHAWDQIINIAFSSANASGGRGTLELRVAGVDILILCCQVSCEAGITAASTPVRVGTNMEVVNGALRSVQNKAATTTQQNGLESKDLSTIDLKKIKDFRKKLFLKAFDMLEKFVEVFHLQNEEEEKDSYFTESSILQVLTKLSQGLTKLFECCKNNELAPYPIVRYTVCSKIEYDDLEGRLVNIINTVSIHAVGDVNSRYLTQAQRTCLDLMREMCTSGSARAFERLAVMGGKSFFWKLTNPLDENIDMDESHSACELLEFEAAKYLSNSFVTEEVSNVTKALVLSMILESFLEQKNKILDTEQDDDKSDIDGSVAFALLIPAVQGGLEAASLIEKEIIDNNADETSSAHKKNSDLLKCLWDRMITSLCFIVSPEGSLARDISIHQSNAILEIISSCLSYTPIRIHPVLGDVLSKGAIYSVGAAKIENNTFGENENCCNDFLRLFEACFTGLGKCDPLGDAIRSIAENSLKDALASSLPNDRNIVRRNALVLGGNTRKHSDLNDNKVCVEVEVSLILCESLRRGSAYLTDLIIAIFPWLCKLTNTNEESIRRKAGAVLGSVDLTRAITRKTEQALEAEQRANEYASENDKLKIKLKQLEAENQKLRSQLMNSSKSNGTKTI